MKLIISVILSISLAGSIGIHQLSVNSIDHSATIDLSNYQGKKMLFVNIASNSAYVGQLTELEQLYQQYSDSLVVIAFPSNSFGNEPLSDSTINHFLDENYSISFPVASMASVKGNDMQSVYKWLTRSVHNGVMNSEVNGDFQKYLVNGQGELIAVFAGSIQAAHPAIIEAITQH